MRPGPTPGDGAAWTLWNDIFPRIGGAGYAWDAVHDSGAANAEKTYALGADAHMLDVACDVCGRPGCRLRCVAAIPPSGSNDGTDTNLFWVRCVR